MKKPIRDKIVSVMFAAMFTASAAVVPGPAFADSGCDAQLAAAWHARGTLPEEATLAQAVTESVCNRNRRTDAGDFSFDEAGLFYHRDEPRESIAQACLTRDSNFFLRNRLQLAISFLPEQDASALVTSCSQGVALAARWTSENKSVVITAVGGSTPDAHPVRVIKALEITPTGALACDPAQLRQSQLDLGGEWVRTSYSVTCTRISDEEISLTIGTSAGDPPTLTLIHTEQIEIKKVGWVIAEPGNQHDFRCVDDSDPGNSDLGGMDQNCVDGSTCLKGRWEASVCAQLHPERSCYVAIDGRRVPGSTRACK